jgi:LmbE family N-acetylglucosaminyl deacetylase
VTLATPSKPSLVSRILRSVGRIILLFVILATLIYAWNPQKLHLFVPNGPSKQQDMSLVAKMMFQPGTRVAVVVGHPDDPEFGISGTLLMLKKARAIIDLIIVTQGDKGYYPLGIGSQPNLASIRKQEQKLASSYYASRIHFLGAPDGRLNPNDREIIRRIQGALNEISPKFIITYEPTYSEIVQHRDHTNTGRMVEKCLLANPATKLFFASRAQNACIDTTGTWEMREKLLKLHKSQWTGDKFERVKSWVFATATNAAEKTGGETAECYRIVPPMR